MKYRSSFVLVTISLHDFTNLSNRLLACIPNYIIGLAWFREVKTFNYEYVCTFLRLYFFIWQVDICAYSLRSISDTTKTVFLISLLGT